MKLIYLIRIFNKIKCRLEKTEWFCDFLISIHTDIFLLSTQLLPIYIYIYIYNEYIYIYNEYIYIYIYIYLEISTNL